MVAVQTNQSAYRCRPGRLCHGSHRTKLVCGSGARRLHGATSFGYSENHFAECHSVHADSGWFLGRRDFQHAFFLRHCDGGGTDIRGLAFRAPPRSGGCPLLARSLHGFDDPMAFWRRNSVCASRHSLDGLSGFERPTQTHCPFLPTLRRSCGLGVFAAARVPMIQAYRATDFGPIRQSTGFPNSMHSATKSAEQRNLTTSSSTTAHGPFLYMPGDLRLATISTARRAEFREYARSIHAKYLITTNAFNEDGRFLVAICGGASR